MIQRAERVANRQRGRIRASRLRAGVPILLFLFAGVCLSACASQSHPRRKPLETIFSPNGEPLNGGPLGHPACPVAIAGWFARVDTNHDGTIDLNEFLADTRRQFAAMDLAKDGEITAAELTTYRAPYGATFTTGPQDEASTTTRRFRRRRGNATGLTGAGRKGDISYDMADPVMSADVNLNFRVNLNDFVAFKTKECAEMDVKHTGRLTLEEVQQTSCPANDQR